MDHGVVSSQSIAVNM